MAVVNPNANQFRIMDYGAAVQSGQQIQYNRIRNEAAGLELEDAQDMLRKRKEAQQIREQVDGMPAQIEALDKAKMFEEADKLRDSYLKTKQAQIAITKGMANVLDADNYQAQRQELITSGLITGDMWPVEYSKDFFERQAATEKSKVEKQSRTWFENGATMSQDTMTRDGQFIWTGTPYPADKGIKKGGAEWKGMDASDTNAIYNQTAGIFGGFYDPTTGRISGLSRDLSQKVAAVTAEASNIFENSQGQIPHAVAVNQAARKLGIEIRDLGKAKDDAGPNPSNPFDLTRPGKKK